MVGWIYLEKKFKIKIIKLPDLILNCNYLTSTKKSAPFYPPLRLGVITAHLRKKGFLVNQDDLNIKTHDQINHFDLKLIIDNHLLRRYVIGEISHPLLEKNVVKVIKQTNIEGFDVILISQGDLYLSIAICKKLKELVNIPIIIGGLEIEQLGYSEIYKIALEKGYIDYLIDGPGIVPLFFLLNSIKNKVKPWSIPGLIYFDNNRVIKNDTGKPTSPIKPDFRGLPLEKYVWDSKNFGIKCLKHNKMLILPFKFIEGCPNSCIFCVSSTSKLNYLDPKKTVKYIKELSEEYNTKYFYFLNDAINISKNYINDLCDEIINNNLGIYWMDCASFKNLDRATLLKMRKAGCIRLFLGLESGSQKLLNYIEKGITIKQASDVLKWSNEAGIWMHISIICGFPEETKEDINKTITFLNNNKKYIDKIDFFRFRLTKKSILFNLHEKYGLNNIRNLCTNKEGISHESPHSFGYDTKNLKWPKIIKKIEYSYVCTKFNSPKTIESLDFEQIPLIFLLYSNLINKVKIKKLYHKYIISLTIKQILKNIIKNPKYILKIYEGKGINELKSKLKMFINR